MIESIGYDGRTYKLVDGNLNPAVPHSYWTSGGVSYKLEGGRAPQHAASEGKVWVRANGGFQREMYPSVFGLKWVPV